MSKKIIFIITIGGLCLFMLFFEFPQIYCKDYYNVVNAEKNILLEDMLSKNGVAQKQEQVNDLQHLYYGDGRTFVFRIFPSGVDEFCRVDVTSDKYRFGKKKIGVGTERKIIESIYTSNKKIRSYREDQLNIIDGGVYLQFYFDEQNLVIKISIGEPD